MAEMMRPKCRGSMVVHWNGQRVRLRPGQNWDALDPLVRDRPDLFEPAPATARAARRERVVEQATAAPDELRDVTPPAAPVDEVTEPAEETPAPAPKRRGRPPKRGTES